MLVLGIETSCDETAAALVRDGREILSSVISSQVPIHKRFGGVVPELASREHLDKIVPVVSEAFERAGVTARDVDGLAVTVGPGLVGSLLVGVSYAKAMAYALNKPFVGVNHIGEVCFSEGAAEVAQQMWWHWNGCAVPYPLSRFVVQLRLTQSGS